MSSIEETSKRCREFAKGFSNYIDQSVVIKQTRENPPEEEPFIKVTLEFCLEEVE